MRWLAKTFTGLLLAATLLAVGGYFAFNYLITQLTKLPPKPTFPNDNPDFIKKNNKPQSPTSGLKPNNKELKEKELKEANKEVTKKPLPAGSFEGRVTYAEGLILRDGSSRGAATIGSVAFNEKVTVLETTADSEWQKIRTKNQKDGWIRGGNVQKE